MTTRRYRRRRSSAAGIIGLIITVAAVGLVMFFVVDYVDQHRQQTPAPTATMAPAIVATPTESLAAPTPPAPARPDPLPAPAATAAAPPPTPAPVRTASPAPSLAWQDEPVARHQYAETAHRCVSGWFELPSTMPDLPTLRCDWRIPVGQDGQPLATAADLVAMFPFPTETSAIDGIGSGLASRFGFTILTLRFPKMRPEDNVPATDRSRWYYYPESGAGDAWIRAIARVRELGRFPERPVFAFGRSGGGSAAHLFTEAHPELVAAIVQEAGRVHAERLRHPGPMLLLHGHHDYVAEACRTLEQRLRSTGSQVARVGFAPDWGSRGTNILWSHGVRGPSADLICQWLAGVANLRLENKGVLPPMAAWPAVEGALRLPDAACRDLVRRITPDRQVASVAGARVTVARPAPATVPRALAVMAIGRFQTAEREVDLDSIACADQGVLAIAAMSEGGPLLSGLRIALGREAAAPGRPWVLAVDQAELLAGALALQPDPPAGVVLFDTSPRSAQAAAALCATRRIPLTIAGGKAQIAALRPAIGGPVTWTALREGNEQQTHADRCKAVLAAIAPAKPAKR